MSEQYQARAGQIVQKILYVTIASVSSANEPWNTPIYSAFDNDGNFYWASSPLAQHSRNIDANGKAFLAIYDSTVPEGAGEGVYVEARAAALDDKTEYDQAMALMARRTGKQLGPETERLLNERIQRVYRATPKRVWMNGFELDENGCYLRDTRVEIPLSCLKNLVTW